MPISTRPHEEVRVSEPAAARKSIARIKPAVPAAPKHLSRAAKAWCRAVVSRYLLEPHHLELLTAACEAWDRMNEARGYIEREGLIVHDRFGNPRAHPAVAIERDARVGFARLLRELALADEAPDDSRPPILRGRYA
jgi:P27 family predicted phage terminase small subunit